MAYTIYITDSNSVFELDTENIDFKAVFAVADLKDLAARKDNVKAVTLKGTKKNNYAFGVLFDLSRSNDVAGLFSNYSPIRAVDALVYEDSILIFKGSLRVSGIKIDRNGEAIYNTVITGTLIDLKTIVQDKKLEDLDFSDSKHLYTVDNIKDTWSGNTKYVYPLIDYGNDNTTNWNPKNFKSGIYVTEYLNKIFNQQGLNGYSYEVKGNQDFIEMFNQLVVPDCQESNYNNMTGITTTNGNIPLGEMPFVTSSSYDVYTDNRLSITHIPLWVATEPPAGTITNLLYDASSTVYADSVSTFVPKECLKFFRNCTLDGSASIFFSSLKNFEQVPIRYTFQIVKRTVDEATAAETGVIKHGNWKVIGETKVTLTSMQELTNQTYNISMALTTFAETDIISVRVKMESDVNLYSAPSVLRGVKLASFVCSSVLLTLPASLSSIVKVEVKPIGDNIIPVPPINIKQVDFLKLLINQFNLYVYSNSVNKKHLIFEKYDNYNAYSQPEYLLANSLDWTNKIDYKSGLEFKTNIDLPKSYNFTYKTDNDYLTDYYYKKFNQVYGSYVFNDSYGLVDTKKIELISSPLIIMGVVGDDKLYTGLYKVDSGIKKVTKTNIRLGIYNGLTSCNSWSIAGDTTLTSYPKFTNYYSGSTGQKDIHFNNPIEYYFNPDSEKYAANSFAECYSGMIDILINPNVIYVTCEALLTPNDISNLDLKIPIFIQTGTMNSSYFRVLSVEYKGSELPSQISLQRIVL